MNPILRRVSHSVGRRLPSGLTWRLRYLNGHRRWPRLSPPRTQNEKILWRILNDRRPELVTCTDKLAAKDLVARSCPEIRVPVTYWKGTDPRELIEFDLPERWVIKPNNSSGLVGEGRGRVDRAEVGRLIALTAGWTDGPHDPATAWRWPWAYVQAERCLIVEEFVGTALGQVDWRGLVIGGELRAVLVTNDVLAYPHSQVTVLGPDLAPIPVRRKEMAEVLPEVLRSKPEGFREVCEQVARATGLEAVRVDLLLVDGQFWFSEATVYPLDGLAGFSPESFDLEMGSYWPDQKALCDTD